jgi:predicted TPR repeat methyltransferase
MPDRDKFDLVTAVDVLEHIEDLKGFLGLLGTGMKPLTRFFHQDCWWITEQYPMHFDHKDSIDQWLGEAGFRITSPTWAVRL